MCPKEQSILVVGAGNSGLAMAAHLTVAGNRVHLWNRSEATIEFLRDKKEILLEGTIGGSARLELVTTDMALALQGVSLVLVTVPASGHYDVAREMAPYLTHDQVILLNPGRTFGAWEVFRTVEQKVGECKAIVAEAQTILYACRKVEPTRVIVYSLKKRVPVAALDPANTKAVLDELPDCLQGFTAAESCLDTSLGNVGMLLHCAPMLFNIGWVESEENLFRYYYDGITPTVARFIELLDRERLAVGQALGADLLSLNQWLQVAYGVQKDTLYESLQANNAYAKIDAPQTLKHRYIYEDIPTGLVPLEAIGSALGIPMTCTSMIIELASNLLDYDFRIHGRNAQRLGIHTRGDVLAFRDRLAGETPSPPP